MLGQCAELAPTLPELYTVQSRILKHSGDPDGAAKAACRAESMDLSDRCAPQQDPQACRMQGKNAPTAWSCPLEAETSVQPHREVDLALAPLRMGCIAPIKLTARFLVSALGFLGQDPKGMPARALDVDNIVREHQFWGTCAGT